MNVLVLGAGLIGTASAWYLRAHGHTVRVLERQSGVALETSFANGGQLSVSHAEPWANPHAPLQILRWLLHDDAPLLFRPRLDPQQWRWILAFLHECLPARTARNTAAIYALAEYSRLARLELLPELNLDFDYAARGILHFYTRPREWAHARRAAARLRALGCARHTIGRDQVLDLEPALRPIASSLCGGDYTETDASGDAQRFCQALAQQAQARGVAFQFHAHITRLIVDPRHPDRIDAVEWIDAQGRYQREQAEHIVLALGSHSASLMAPLGQALLLYPGKGYSATLDICAAEHAPQISLTDDACKLVFSRLGTRLRVAGTCELSGNQRALNDVRTGMLIERTRTLFPDACDWNSAQFWSGLRPLTPSNVPYLGGTRWNNLSLNTGHGTLGWTMALGAGRALAEHLAGQPPAIAFPFC